MANNKKQTRATTAQTSKKIPDHNFIHDVEHDVIFPAISKFIEDTYGTCGGVVAIANYKGKVRIYGKTIVLKALK